MMKSKGIAFKTFVFTALLITAVICISFGILYFVLPDYYQYTKYNTLKSNADALAEALNSADEKACAALISEFSLKNNADVFSLDHDGALLPFLSSPFVLMSGETRPGYSLIIGTNEGRQEGSLRSTTIIMQKSAEDAPADDENIQFYIKSDEPPDTIKLSRKVGSGMSVSNQVQNDIIGSLYISSTLQPIDEAQGVMLSLLPFLLLLDIAIALLFAFMYAKRLTKPIVQISDAAAQMQLMQPGVRSGVRSGDELGHLSKTLDSMYSSLRESIESLQLEIEKVHALEQSKTDFMRSAGHELKTPIAALNGILEGMIDNVGVYRDKETYLVKCKTLVDNLARLVSEILSASRAETPMAERHMEDVELQPLIEEILTDNQPMIAEKSLCVDVGSLQITLQTDRGMLRQALNNLLSNAVAYTPIDGQIRVSLAEENSQAILSIENTCDPIPEDELPRLFEPFYTRDFSRNKTVSGTGLGLYIAKRNLDALDIGCELCSEDIGLLVRLSWDMRIPAE